MPASRMSGSRMSGSRMSGQTRTSSVSSDYVDPRTVVQTFILINRGPLLFTLFGIAVAVFLICGIVRSAYILNHSVGKYNVAQKTKLKLNTFSTMESMAELIYRESFARIKYIATGLDPIYFNEMTTAVNDIDNVFAENSGDFADIYFKVSEFRQYMCSFYQIRSNLAQRASAIPLNQHRSLDERNLDPYDDVDFYNCLLTQLADIQQQAFTSTDGFDYIFPAVYAYMVSFRSLLSFQVAFNYAYLIRELVLKKGSVVFKRQSDSEALEDAMAMAQLLVRRAYQVAYWSIGPSSLPAIIILDNMMHESDGIANATKVYLMVSRGDKFEPSSTAKTVLNLLTAATAEFKEDMIRVHGLSVDQALSEIVSESVKLFIFIAILPILAYRCLVHMKNEGIRLTARYETCIERFAESCRATFRLLPEPVAKKLNVGMQIRPEYYHNATVFYSDIVGFTTICSKLSAIEVLRMLNTIYTTFDHRMKIYKCYKIETIGDAYVVASGVPTRTTAHAAHIASLALVLIEEVGLIKLPNSKQKISVRIGINSGPVIAGIVGVKMPRYCLFGKSVLYANRLEQTSKPQRIHISDTAQMELENMGGFVTEERPKEEWPAGRPTYWLIGKTTTLTPLSLFGCIPDEFQTAHVDISNT